MTALRFDTASLSRTGARANNEDACGFRDGCWVVADGLGGHGGGEVAARLAVEALLRAWDPTAPLTTEALTQGLAAAAAAIHGHQAEDPGLMGMRTTLVVLATDGAQALWAHVGDSRLYLLRDGRVLIQTEDHSVPQALVRAGELTPAEVRTHPDRNRLLRALGDGKPPRPDLAATPLAIQPGDAFLLCSDGFWEAVTEGDMEVALAKATDAHDWLERMALRLRRQAKPDQDNYTALAILAEAPPSS